MDLLISYAEPILIDVREDKDSCGAEYLEDAYKVVKSIKEENIFTCLVVLIPLAKHPKTPKHIIKELMESSYASVSGYAKLHPSVQNYAPFE